MRAAKGRQWQPVQGYAGYGAPPRRTVYKRPAAKRGGARGRLPVLGFGAAFFLGYIPGILAGRGGGFGVSALAGHYMDKQTFSAFGPVFADAFGAAFLQVTLVLLAGFCALGLGLLAAVFALKGMYLGYCAASIYAAGGAGGLAAHWLLSFLPDIGILLILLALAARAAPLSFALLRGTFDERPQTGTGLYPLARALILRYALAVAVAALCCGLGSALAVCLAGILL